MQDPLCLKLSSTLTSNLQFLTWDLPCLLNSQYSTSTHTCLPPAAESLGNVKDLNGYFRNSRERVSQQIPACRLHFHPGVLTVATSNERRMRAWRPKITGSGVLKPRTLSTKSPPVSVLCLPISLYLYSLARNCCSFVKVVVILSKKED